MATPYPALAVSEVRWQPCFRVISSRFPPIHLFERVAGAQDWEALYWLESLTNPRLRDDVGEIELVPREDRDRLSELLELSVLDPWTRGACDPLFAADSGAISVD